MLWNGAKGEGEEGPRHDPPAFAVFGEEVELAVGRCLGDDLGGATGQVTHQQCHQCQTDENDHRLEQVGEGHRPHAAKDGVDHDDCRADEDAAVEIDGAAAENMDDQAQRRHLRRRPAQVRANDGQAGQHFNTLAIALFVEVANGQQVHAVKKLGKQQRRQHQAQAGAKGVAGDARQAVFGKRGRHRQHGFCAKPGCKHRGDVHVQRQ